MDICYDPFSEIFFWYYEIWQRQKKDLSQDQYTGTKIKCNKYQFNSICYSPYHMIPNGNFATCPILARTTSWNHWEMGKEVVNFGAALDARVTPSISAENWRKEHRTQSSITPFRDLDFVLTMSFNLTVTLKQVPAFILLIGTPVLHHFTILCLICLNAYIMWLKQAYRFWLLSPVECHSLIFKEWNPIRCAIHRFILSQRRREN